MVKMKKQLLNRHLMILAAVISLLSATTTYAGEW